MSLPGELGRGAAAGSRRCCILIVNGFDRHGRWGAFNVAEARRYPWIDLCLRQVERHTPGGGYQIFVYDNSWLPEHRRAIRAHPLAKILPRGAARVERGHPAALDYLVRRTSPQTKYIVTLDSDAFPIRDGWLDDLIAPLEAGAGISGIYRDEMSDKIRPFIHPSCLCARREELMSYGVSFAKGRSQDIGQNLSDVLSRDRLSAPLRRSNVRNFHPVMGGIYSDLVYHNGAGGRRPRFWGQPADAQSERIRTALRDAAFHNLDELIAVLRGKASGMTSNPGLAALLAAAPTEGAGPALNGTAASLNGTAASLNGTAASLNGTAASLNGTAASLNGTAATAGGEEKHYAQD